MDLGLRPNLRVSPDMEELCELPQAYSIMFWADNFHGSNSTLNIIDAFSFCVFGSLGALALVWKSEFLWSIALMEP